jgi:hypothetical protein
MLNDGESLMARVAYLPHGKVLVSLGWAYPNGRPRKITHMVLSAMKAKA